MSVLQTTWRELVRRRLLPVAVLLLAGLVAVPVVLAKDPEPAAPVAIPATGASTTMAIAEPVVSLRDGQPTRGRRRVVGSPKDPFAPAPLPKAKAAAHASTAGGSASAGAADSGASVATGPTGGSGSSSSDTGASVGGSSFVPTPSTGSGTPSAPSTGSDDAKQPEPTFPRDSVDVRFGDDSTDLPDAQTLEPLTPLQADEDPVVVYLGLKDHGRIAAFLLDDGVQADGDGVCEPDPTTCTSFTLRAGETEFLTVPDANGQPAVEYELDLVKIHHQVAAQAATAGKARATTATARAAAARKLAEAATSGDHPANRSGAERARSRALAAARRLLDAPPAAKKPTKGRDADARSWRAVLREALDLSF